jgi:hypothetical protein
MDDHTLYKLAKFIWADDRKSFDDWGGSDDLWNCEWARILAENGAKERSAKVENGKAA